MGKQTIFDKLKNYTLVGASVWFVAYILSIIVELIHFQNMTFWNIISTIHYAFFPIQCAAGAICAFVAQEDSITGIMGIFVLVGWFIIFGFVASILLKKLEE